MCLVSVNAILKAERKTHKKLRFWTDTVVFVWLKAWLKNWVRILIRSKSGRTHYVHNTVSLWNVLFQIVPRTLSPLFKHCNRASIFKFNLSAIWSLLVLELWSALYIIMYFIFMPLEVVKSFKVYLKLVIKRRCFIKSFKLLKAISCHITIFHNINLYNVPLRLWYPQNKIDWTFNICLFLELTL